MNRIILTVLCFACCSTMMAQQAKIGFFSMQDLLNTDATYQETIANVTVLKQQYANEQKIAEEDFKEKYELFLEQQATLAPSIRDKRQSDLQSLLERTEKFRKESQQLIKQSEESALATAKSRIYDAIRYITANGDYLIIVNTDSDACPYINPAYSEEVTEQISSVLANPTLLSPSEETEH